MNDADPQDLMIEAMRLLEDELAAGDGQLAGNSQQQGQRRTTWAVLELVQLALQLTQGLPTKPLSEEVRELLAEKDAAAAIASADWRVERYRQVVKDPEGSKAVQDVAEDEVWALRWELDATKRACEHLALLRSYLVRYREEVPLGHQPHMLAQLVDEALGRA